MNRYNCYRAEAPMSIGYKTFITVLLLISIILWSINIIILRTLPASVPPIIGEEGDSTVTLLTTPTLRIVFDGAPLTQEEYEFIKQLSLEFGWNLDEYCGIMDVQKHIHTTILLTRPD
jgi:hypothetical protein